MAVYIDVVCNLCDTIREDVWSSVLGTPCVCGGTWEYSWSLTPAPAPGTHPSERCVVYQSAQEGGKIQYPGRNDAPVPERLRRRGYERVEVHAHQMGAFERRHGVKNERRHFDRNGRGFEN